MKRLFLVALGLLTLMILLPGAAKAATQTRTIRYGPFTLPAGSATTPSEISRLRLAVARPCLDCYITAFQPDLVYADANFSRADLSTGPMLHHVVFSSQFRSDATCRGSWLGLAGERFFASGNERTTISMPPGYGYRVRWYDSWNMLTELMNHAPEEKTVYVQVTYSYRPASDPVAAVKPVWLDIDQCDDSEYAIPAGYSDTHWDWNVNVPGKVVSMAGHVHGHGIAVEATRGRTSICRSVAELDPTNVHNVVSMSTCVGDPLARLRTGQIVRLHSEYQSAHAADDVMGIMLAYIRPA